MTSLRQKPLPRTLRLFHMKACGWVEEKKTLWVSGRQNEKIEEGRKCHKTAKHFLLLLYLLLPVLLLFRAVLLTQLQLSFSVLSSFASCHPQMNSMNSVSSSEDIKPPPGLQNLGNINYQCTSPGGMSKHICAICGDRSSGNVRGRGWGKGWANKSKLPLTANIATQMTTQTD